MKQQEVILTGDRPSGQLHLGHFVGSLQNRVQLQDQYKQYIIIADVQALTDNYEDPEKVKRSVVEVMMDYLACGIDPQKSTIFIQSQIPEIAELTLFYLNLVTVARLQRNPTVKTEIAQKGFDQSVPAGFFMYPVSQAADITCVKGTLIPVGDDQLPMIEQTNEIVRSFNRIYGKEVLVEAKPMLAKTSRLPGLDGKAKMSKSLNNTIFLGATEDELHKAVMSMYTDPNHVKISDPGQIEGNVVFMYLDAFDTNTHKISELKSRYQAGGLGDVMLKKYLFEVLNELLTPIRDRRRELEKNKYHVMDILMQGTARTREVTAQTLHEVKEVMKLIY